MLDQLHPISTGLDLLPAWFLKLAAPVFCKPIAYLFNLSISAPHLLSHRSGSVTGYLQLPKFPHQRPTRTTNRYLSLQY